jgi:hypothetical protein
MSRHRRHRERVQRLEQKGGDSADEHRRVSLHRPDRPVIGEQPLPRRPDRGPALISIRPGDPLKDRPADPSAQVTNSHDNHDLILANRPGRTHRARLDP